MRILQLIGAMLLLVASPALAKDGSAAWVVTQKSGDVRVIRNGLQPASVQVRSALSPGDVVATGANGRAMLTRGDDYVIVAPASRLLLPKEEQQRTGFTRLIQQVGTMLYKVRHTGTPHFAVETPMLAAVVKGTRFTVIVDKDRAAVQVTEGLVEVSSAAGNARRLVERGMTVYVGRERPDEIIEMTPGAGDLPGTGGGSDAVKIESSGEVSLSTITNLTGGLVREAPVAPAIGVSSNPIVKVVALAPVAETPTATPDATAPDTGAPIAPTPDVTSVPVTTPEIQTPPVTTPVIAIGEVTVPSVTVPEVTVPAVSTPVLTTPTLTTPTLTTPTLTTPTLSTPTLTTPIIPTPIATVPSVTVPTVTVPTVTVPTVTVPTVTVPPVTAPTLIIPLLPGG